MENIKYIRKDKNHWIISNTKTGKSLRNADTQKEAIALAKLTKNVNEIFVKKPSGWVKVFSGKADAAIRSVVKETTAKTTSKKATNKKPKSTKSKTTTKTKSTKVMKSSVEKDVAVRFKNITKKFGKLVANKDINFDVYKNEVHALLGENGAGKSTLMSILFGLYTPTSGKIEINGEQVTIKDPRHANELKIAMLPQHFKLVENMTVVENVILGYEKLNKSDGNARDIIADLAEKFKIKIDLKAKVQELPVSDKQKVEILKILWRNADIIIFDEPTSILTPSEIQEFLKLVTHLKKLGKTILIITHKLPEIKAVADRVTVIRKGEYIDTLNVSTTSEKQMAELMVGKAMDFNLSTIKKNKVNEEISVLKIDNLNYEATGFAQSLHDVSLEIKSGEIVGIAAIDGNGQSELMRIIGGMLQQESGTIKISNHDVSNWNAKKLYYSDEEFNEKDTVLRIKKLYETFKPNSKVDTKKISTLRYEDQITMSAELAEKQIEEISAKNISEYDEGDFYWNRKLSSISHIPEDRHEHGLILDYSVAKNAILQDIDFFSNKFGFLNKKGMKERLTFLQEKYDVRGIQSFKTPSRTLSGGNQQKLILGREIERGSSALLAVHPTRGLDVGAIRNVYENIISARNKGTAILLSSGELDEIMQVSDRIIVMHEGKIVSNTKAGELTKQQIGSLMAGGK